MVLEERGGTGRQQNSACRYDKPPHTKRRHKHEHISHHFRFADTTSGCLPNQAASSGVIPATRRGEGGEGGIFFWRSAVVMTPTQTRYDASTNEAPLLICVSVLLWGHKSIPQGILLNRPSLSLTCPIQVQRQGLRGEVRCLSRLSADFLSHEASAANMRSVPLAHSWDFTGLPGQCHNTSPH